MELGPFGKTLIIIGIILILLGLAIVFGGKILPLGRLPGDIAFKRGNFTLFFPIVTCIILSIILTILLNFFLRR